MIRWPASCRLVSPAPGAHRDTGCARLPHLRGNLRTRPLGGRATGQDEPEAGERLPTAEAAASCIWS